MKHLLALPYEIWRDIKGYEGLYQVSNLGRVKSLERVVIYKDGRRKVVKETIVKPRQTKHKYLQVCLYKNSKGLNHYIHRLVAEVFKPNPHNYPTVDHINRIRTDNRVDNLRWAPWILQAKNSSAKDVNAKRCSIPVKQYTLDMVFVAIYSSAREAERQTSIWHGNIIACCKHKIKSAGGYIWKYADIQ